MDYFVGFYQISYQNLKKKKSYTYKSFKQLVKKSKKTENPFCVQKN